MITFIIVDDEPLALESFPELCDWSAMGYELVGSAANGRQAQELIEQKHPDIVFTDIRMPVMDGLELCEWIYRQQLETRVVILTGYQDFEYARVALSFGVKEYLLKNQIDRENVLRLLDKLSAGILEDRRKQTIEHSHYYQRALLNMTPLSQTAQPGGSDCCCVLVTVRASYVLKHFGLEESERVPLDMDSFSELLSSDDTFTSPKVVWVDDMSWGLVLEGSGGAFCSIAGVREPLGALWSRICRYFSERYGREVFGMYELCRDNPSQVKECLTRMREYSTCGCFYHGAECYPCQSVRSCCRNTDENHPFIRGLIGQLADGASAGDEQRVTESLSALREEYLQPVPDAGKLHYILEHLLEQLDRLRIESAISPLKEYVAQTRDELAGTVTLKDTWRWVEREFAHIAHMRTPAKEQSENRRITQALEYIHRNYAQNLTAQQVCEQVGLSKVYFCGLFKQETGVTFGDYLTTYRINVAKYLLTNGDYKVYEVAEMTGYGSPQYFSQLFQKRTGVSPQAYKTYGGKAE